MKVEAIKVENGLLIPFDQLQRRIRNKTVLLEVEFIDRDKLDEGYAILGELVGLCESSRADAAVNHDAIIYELESKK